MLSNVAPTIACPRWKLIHPDDVREATAPLQKITRSEFHSLCGHYFEAIRPMIPGGPTVFLPAQVTPVAAGARRKLTFHHGLGLPSRRDFHVN
jgi:hypothetical protein